MHPLATHFDNADTIAAEIADRAPDDTNHTASTRALIDAHHPTRLHLMVSEIYRETASTKTFRLRRPKGGTLPPFMAGQYVTVYIGGTTRAYAISSSPAETDHWDLTVRSVPGGRISNLLLDRVSTNDEMVVSGPHGTFHHNPLFHGSDTIFIAGGSGVAPAMSMIRDIVTGGLDRRLHLIYGSRDGSDIIFADELAQHAGTHPNITVRHVIGELITAETITSAVGRLANRMVYVCGPQALYPHTLSLLDALGHPRHRTRFEANGAPQRPETQSSWPIGADPGEEVSITVGHYTFRAPTGRPLLDSLEDHKIQPESYCRSGDCSQCRVKVIKGVAHQADEAKPRLSDAAYGYVHSCVAYPITDLTLEF